jgi:oxalate decarboxylase
MAAAASGLLMSTSVAASAAAAEPGKAPAGNPTELPAFSFPLEKQTPRVGNGGSAREASAEHFHVSTGIAGVSMKLAPGTLRELHWHANAAEWGYVVTGYCRVTIYSPDGKSETLDFGPSDVWYIPRGHGHSIQGLGNAECHFILVFDNGYFSEFATFSFSDWLAHTPKEVLAKNLHMPAASFADLPTKEVYFAKGLPPSRQSRSQMAAESVHRYRLDAVPAKKFVGGELRLATVKEFPISTTMSGGTMLLYRNGLRELHWHPNADEWQYVLSGKIRMTVFASSGRAETVEMGPGEVGYVPQGYGHYLENIADTASKVLLVFNAGAYEDISLTGWIASNPKPLVAANLEMTESFVSSLPKRNLFITE